MNIQQLINYLSSLENKERQVFIYNNELDPLLLTIDMIDDCLDDRLDFNN
jgi:hypothetical protein